MTTENPSAIGRNEPCPCGSGRKYKRCCGAGAAPKLSQPKIDWSAPAPASTPGAMPPGMEGVSPEVMMQVSQMLQRLPKGQLQKLQGIMQRAMAGKDVKREADEFERTLPPEFKDMLGGLMGAQQAGFAAQAAPFTEEGTVEDAGPVMSAEEARQIIEQAAAQGKIDHEQAAALLQGNESPPTEGGRKPAAGLGKLWKNITGKK